MISHKGYKEAVGVLHVWNRRFRFTVGISKPSSVINSNFWKPFYPAIDDVFITFDH